MSFTGGTQFGNSGFNIGWTLTTSTRIYSGRPLFFNQNLLVDGNPKISNPTISKWFDTSKFHRLPTTTNPDGVTITVPYTLATAAYPESVRCSVLAGCGGSHTTVDTIGVRITYQHFWLTSFVRFAGNSVTFTEASITRAEPQL